MQSVFRYLPVATLISVSLIAAVSPSRSFAQGDSSRDSVPRPDHDITPIRTRPAKNTRYTEVTGGTGTLPNSAGQVWREYDISSYVDRMKNVDHPEQAIVDWSLRETGTDHWFREPVGVLSASDSKLRVYHTPKTQRVVARIVDRFVTSNNDQVGVSV
ncbi:MAG: hypothetical protein KDB27_07435, partial [Planctomycetales bacterium]|nr:hypothetical protein [Planctomycetales bacterium]